MDSTRLPGKALLNLNNKKIVEWPISALLNIDGIRPILATSDREEDKELCNFAALHNIDISAGPIDDVAKRVIECCQKYEIDYFFRINGDSPFINLALLKKALSYIEAEDYDLVSNLITRTYPYGISCELIKVDSFIKAYKHFDTFQKEHITNYIYKNLESFKHKELQTLEVDYQKIDFTVDTEDDLRRLNYYINQSEHSDFNSIEIRELIKDYKKVIDNYQYG